MDAGLGPIEVLLTPVATVAAMRRDGTVARLVPRRIEATGDRLATVVLPLRTTIARRPVSFSAQVDLAPLAARVHESPFARRGEIAVIDAEGRTVLEPAPRGLADRAIRGERRTARRLRRAARGDRGLRAPRRAGDARRRLRAPDGRSTVRPRRGRTVGLRQPIVGMTNSASARMPVGQRVVMVFRRV